MIAARPSTPQGTARFLTTDANVRDDLSPLTLWHPGLNLSLPLRSHTSTVSLGRDSEREGQLDSRVPLMLSPERYISNVLDPLLRFHESSVSRRISISFKHMPDPGRAATG